MDDIHLSIFSLPNTKIRRVFSLEIDTHGDIKTNQTWPAPRGVHKLVTKREEPPVMGAGSGEEPRHERRDVGAEREAALCPGSQGRLPRGAV